MGNDLDDYNRQKTLGPTAGPPTSIVGWIDQQDYQRDNAFRHDSISNASSSGGQMFGKPPDWLVTSPIRRGLLLFLTASIILLA